MSEVAIVTVSEKGQIVLPKKMRDTLKIHEGSRLWLEEKNDRIEIIKLDSSAMDANAPFFLSHRSLAKDWFSKEDEEAWKNL